MKATSISRLLVQESPPVLPRAKRMFLGFSFSLALPSVPTRVAQMMGRCSRKTGRHACPASRSNRWPVSFSQTITSRRHVNWSIGVSPDHGTGSLRRLRVVLAEPVVRRRLPATAKHSGDIDWLRRNAYSYSGKWVALGDGKLLAANESLPALRRHLREIAPKIKPFLHRL